MQGSGNGLRGSPEWENNKNEEAEIKRSIQNNSQSQRMTHVSDWKNPQNAKQILTKLQNTKSKEKVSIERKREKMTQNENQFGIRLIRNTGC